MRISQTCARFFCVTNDGAVVSSTGAIVSQLQGDFEIMSVWNALRIFFIISDPEKLQMVSHRKFNVEYIIKCITVLYRFSQRNTTLHKKNWNDSN